MRKRTANPFLLPTHTENSFFILVTAAVLFVSQVALLTSDTAMDHLADASDRLRTVTEQPDLGNTGAGSAKAFAGDLLGIVMLIILYAILRYYLHPWIIRLGRGFGFDRLRQRLPFGTLAGATQDPKLTEEIRVLSETAQIHNPKLELGQNWNLQTAQAFGFAPFTVRLEAGFRVLYRTKPEEARAIILHELAHIRNGDIRRGWLASSIITGPIAYAAVVLLNRALGISRREAGLDLPNYLAGIATAVFLIYYYSRFLRAREVYADCRARVWGAGSALYGILAEAVRTCPRRKRGVFSLHPSAATRIKYLAMPEVLFDVSQWDMVGIGALFGMAGPVAVQALSVLVVMLIDSTSPASITSKFALILSLVVVDLAFSYAVTATVGAAIQRQAIEVLVSKQRRKETWRTLASAVSISIGFCIGAKLVSLGIGNMTVRGTIVWAAVSAVLTGLAFLFVQFTTKRASRSVTSEKSLRNRVFVVKVLGTLMFSALLPFLLFLRSLLSMTPESSTRAFPELVGPILGGLFVLFAFVYCSLWGITLILIAVAWRCRTTKCRTCLAEFSGPTLASICRSCGSEITPWASVEWLGEFEAPFTSAPEPPELFEPVRVDIEDQFELRSLSDLENKMITVLSAKSMTATHVCEVFNGKSEAECLEALQCLEKAGAIVVDPESRFRESAAIPSNAVIYFPRRTWQKVWRSSQISPR